MLADHLVIDFWIIARSQSVTQDEAGGSVYASGMIILDFRCGDRKCLIAALFGLSTWFSQD